MIPSTKAKSIVSIKYCLCIRLRKLRKKKEIKENKTGPLNGPSLLPQRQITTMGKPSLSLEHAASIIQTHWRLTPTEMKPLCSYDEQVAVFFFLISFLFY
jgi:hypothetical protein